MSTTAIQLAFQLAKQPEEMKWLYLSETPLPSGITDLLRLCASNKRLERFSDSIDVDPIKSRKILISFIEKVLVNDSNFPHKILGLESNYKIDQLKLHYQLLIKVFHPDISVSEQASQKTKLLSKAYKELKKGPEESLQFKNIKLSRTPPKSFYSATRNAAIQHSELKNTFIIFGGLGLISLSIVLSYFLSFGKPELYATSQQATFTPALTPQKIPTSNFTYRDNDLNIEKANFSGVAKSDTTEALLQTMLRNIEIYYESGNVRRIKPILANMPEMRSQSDEEIQTKLETLFDITQERKMLLYSFEWKNFTGKIRGIGKFLFRYQMTDEMSWQTREGTVRIQTTEIGGDLFVTGLELENNIIE